MHLPHQFDVSVDYSNFVAIIKRYDELLEEPSGFIFLKAISLLDILEHVATRSKFHGNSQVFICQEHFLELNDVGVQQPVVVE